MKTTIFSTLLPCAAACALSVIAPTGCEEAPDYYDDPAGDVEFRSTGGDDDGGFDFNTNMMIGYSVPWVDPSGVALNGVTLDGVVIHKDGSTSSIDLETLEVFDGGIRGSKGGDEYLPSDFAGSIWTFDINGTPLDVELVEVTTANAVGFAATMDEQRYLYKFVYDDPDIGDSIPTCTHDVADGGVWMVMYDDFIIDEQTGEVQDRESTIVFACLSSAMGKPARFNLAPGNPSEPGFDDLSDYQAAVRMYRADYCGDGEAYTVTGKPLTFRDHLGINDHAPGAAFSTEAQWTANGATCVNKIRLTNEELEQPLACPSGESIPLCGDEVDAENKWIIRAPILWSKTPIGGS